MCRIAANGQKLYQCDGECHTACHLIIEETSNIIKMRVTQLHWENL